MTDPVADADHHEVARGLIVPSLTKFLLIPQIDICVYSAADTALGVTQMVTHPTTNQAQQAIHLEIFQTSKRKP